MPPSKADDSLRVLQAMVRAGVPFVVIGGHAVIVHGYVRTTEDADIVFRRTDDSETLLVGYGARGYRETPGHGLRAERPD